MNSFVGVIERVGSEASTLVDVEVLLILQLFDFFNHVGGWAVHKVQVNDQCFKELTGGNGVGVVAVDLLHDCPHELVVYIFVGTEGVNHLLGICSFSIVVKELLVGIGHVVEERLRISVVHTGD